MPIYKICDIPVSMQPKYEPLLSQSKPYLYDCAVSPAITIEPEESFLIKKAKRNNYPSTDICEYVTVGSLFYRKLLNFNGFLLHSSAIEYENKAYVFSAPCGTGKSTHTKLWIDHFGKDKVKYINDDKPALMIKDNKCIVCGTPFSGKTNLNSDISVELQAICFIYRSEKNEIRKCSTKKAIKYILEQTLKSVNADGMCKLLTMIDTLLKNYPVYEMGCNISDEAVSVAYNAMKGN